MDLFVNGKLNHQVFDMDVRQGTHDLSDVLVAAAHTQSTAVESTHFLMAVAKVPGGMTQKSLARLGMTAEQWESGLATCAVQTPGGLPPAHLLETSLHDSAMAMLRATASRCTRDGRERISESILLLSALQHATPAVCQLCASADIDLTHWCKELEDALTPVTPLEVFKHDGMVRLDTFSPSAKKVLRLLRTEAESLGYQGADPRHLLLALLAQEGGATHYGLYHQSNRYMRRRAIMGHLPLLNRLLPKKMSLVGASFTQPPL